MIDRLLARVKVRLKGDIFEDALLTELIVTATDRITLRVEDLTFPQRLDSIAVDVVVKMFRRLYHEGIEAEKADTLSTTFINSVMNEYDAEFESYIRSKSGPKGVRFL